MQTYKKIIVVAAIVATIPMITLAAQAPISVSNASQFPNSAVNAQTSLNWSGYVADRGTFTSVSGSWIVPDVASASSTMADATWVGIGGVTSENLIQAGTQALTDRRGNVTYEAWYEMLPQDMQTIELPIRPGDAMSVSLTETSADVWQVSFIDRTTGATYTTSLNYHSSLSSAEWIEEMPTANIGALPLDNFGSVMFTGGSATENGESVTIAGSNAKPLTMVTRNGSPLASPSVLGTDGASFAVNRSAAATPSTSAVARYGSGRRGYRTTGFVVSSGFGNAGTGGDAPFLQSRIFQILRAQLGLNF